MHKVYVQTDQPPDWKALISGLHIQRKVKRQRMEVLDGLERDRKLIG